MWLAKAMMTQLRPRAPWARRTLRFGLTPEATVPTCKIQAFCKSVTLNYFSLNPECHILQGGPEYHLPISIKKNASQNSSYPCNVLCTHYFSFHSFSCLKLLVQLIN